MSVYGNIITEEYNESLDINLETACLEFSNYCSFIDEFVLESDLEILNEGFKEIFAKIKEKAIKIFVKIKKKIRGFMHKNKQKVAYYNFDFNKRYNEMMQMIQNKYSDIYFDFLNGKIEDENKLKEMEIKENVRNYPLYFDILYDEYSSEIFKILNQIKDDFDSLNYKTDQIINPEVKINVHFSIDDKKFDLDMKTLYDLYKMPKKEKMKFMFFEYPLCIYDNRRFAFYDGMDKCIKSIIDSINKIDISKVQDPDEFKTIVKHFTDIMTKNNYIQKVKFIDESGMVRIHYGDLTSDITRLIKRI